MWIIRNRKLPSILILCSFWFLFYSQANAIHFNNSIFIGDSLTDQGKCKILGAPVTNGNTWAYYLGQKLDIPTIPPVLININGTFIGGNDFACAGASTGFTSGFLPTIVQSGLRQIQDAINSGIPFNSKTLFTYWLGADDILLQPGGVESIPFYPAFHAATSVNNIKQGLDALHQAGAKYIIVLNMPDLSQIPAARDPSVTAPIGPQSSELNRAMLQTLNNIGYEVIQLDIFSVMNTVISNSTKFGYTNVTDQCATNDGVPIPGRDCATYLFFDHVHPTDKTHRIITDFIYSVLTLPEFVATLAEVPFSMMQTQYTQIRQQLYPTQQPLDLDKYYSFASTSGMYKDYPVTSDRVDYKGINGSATVGVIKAVNNWLALGAALGHDINHINYDQHGSGYNAHATSVALFATLAKGKFYLNSIINYAYLHFSNIERKFAIGPAILTAQGDTSGHQHGVAFDGGYNLSNRDDIQWGPTASFEYQSVSVNGYTETGAESFDFVIGNQTNESIIGGAGWQVIFNKIPYTEIPVRTQLFVNINKQFRGDDERHIYFHQASLDANFASLPVQTPAPTFGNGGVNFIIPLKRNLTASLSYLGTWVDDGSHSQLLLASITLAI